MGLVQKCTEDLGVLIPGPTNMAKEDEEKTAFITPFGVYCNVKMSFGVKKRWGHVPAFDVENLHQSAGA